MEVDIKLLKIQNQWWDSGCLKYDPVIASFNSQALKFKPQIIKRINLQDEKITVLQGGRGVGKTTVIKLLIQELIEKKKINPRNIFYYSCHNLNSKEQLNELIKTFLNWRQEKNRYKEKLYIFIDEVTLLKSWDKGIEYLETAGVLKNTKVLLSGSIYFDLEEDNKKYKNKWENIRIKSLSFKEAVLAMDKNLYKKLQGGENNFKKYKDRLEYYLDIYFLTGGYISTINSFLSGGVVKQDIYSSYLYWLIADVARMKRDMVLFRQITEEIINFLGQAFGFQTLSRKTKAQTHNTVAGYIKMLQAMFVAQVNYQLKDKTKINKSAAKKIYFRDPFIFWVFYAYLHGSLNYWQFSREYIHKKNVFNYLLENIIFDHLLKKEYFTNWEHSVAFIRKKQEKIDIPFVDINNSKNIPIILRYNKKIDNKDIDIFKKAGFKKGIIISHNVLEKKGQFKTMPLSYFLFYY